MSDDHFHPTADAGDRPPAPGEEELRSICESFLEELESGHMPDRGLILAAHPHLGPALAERLETVEKLFRTALAGDAPAPLLDPDRVRCPHCGHGVLLGGEPQEPAVCGGCGGAFRIDPAGENSGGKPELPAAIDKFQILELLGKGAFGMVYKAWDSELDRIIALKVPRAGCFTSSEEEARFLREARSAASLRHPGIVQVHEVLQADGMPCIVREYIEGRTLEEIIRAGRADCREAAQLAACAAEALEHAHQRRVIHRDVKPANIIIDAAGSPHLADFGLARRDEGEVTVTLEGQVLGTPVYMSPEQARGEIDRIDGRSDVYSLGAVLYEMLSGERPFSGNRSMVIYQVIHDEPRPPRRLNQHIPRDLETICLKAMAKEPAGRYASAADFAADLRRFLRSEPVAARPVPPAARLWRWCRRNPALGGLGAAVLLLLAAVAIGSTFTAWHLESERLKTGKALEESNKRLVRLNVAAAAKHMEKGEHTAALPYLAEAMRLDRGGGERVRLHRLRLGAVLAACPRPSRIWLHPGKVHRAVFDPECKAVATACEDGAVRIWSAATGEAAAAPLVHGKAVLDCRFSPDGKLLAASGADGQARLWEWEEGRLRAVLEHRKAVYRIAFSADGRRVATASADGTARVWDAGTGAALCKPLKHGSAVKQAAFSPDGMRIIAAVNDGTAAVWDWASARKQFTVKHFLTVHQAVFSPDGSRLLTSSQDGSAQLWDAATGEASGPPLKNPLGVLQSAFSPDGGRVATCGWSNEAIIWNARTSQPLAPPLDCGASVLDVAFRPDGRCLATAASDGTVRVWDAITGEQKFPALHHGRQAVDVCFNREGNLLLTASFDGTARLWDLTWHPDRILPFHLQNEAASARFSDDGRLAVTAGRDKTAWIWETAGLQPVAPPLEHNSSISTACFSPGGDRVLTAGVDRAARIWDAATGSLVRSLKVPAEIHAALFSPDGKLAAAACSDGTVEVWNAATGERAMPAIRYARDARALAFSADGRFLATGGNDGVAQIWSLAGGKPSAGPLEHGDPLLRAAFSPDGRLLAVGTSEEGIWLWDAATGKQSGAPLEHSRPIHSLRFSSDGKLLIAAGSDQTARIWSLDGDRPLVRRLAHPRTVEEVGFSGDGLLAATACGDGAARIWDWRSGELAAPPLVHQGDVNTAQFSPDGGRLLTASDDGSARLWDLTPDLRPAGDLVLLAELVSGRKLEEGGVLVALEAAELEQRHGYLRSRYPDDFEFSSKRFEMWRSRQATESEMAADWPAAVFHINRAIDAGATGWLWFTRRGRARAELGDHAGSTEDYRKSIELGAPECGTLHMLALLHLRRGDLDGYRKICSGLLDAYRDTPSPLLAHHSAWACVLAPDAVPDYSPAIALAGRVVAEDPSPSSINTLGAVLFRAGRFDAAVENLRLSQKAHKGGGHAFDWVFLAMAHARLGRSAPAIECLRRASSLIGDGEKDAIPTGQTRRGSWVQRLERRLLKIEAEAMIKALAPAPR